MLAAQVNTALADQQPGDKLDYSLRQEMDQVVSVGARIAGAMIKYVHTTGTSALKEDCCLNGQTCPTDCSGAAV